MFYSAYPLYIEKAKLYDCDHYSGNSRDNGEIWLLSNIETDKMVKIVSSECPLEILL